MDDVFLSVRGARRNKFSVRNLRQFQYRETFSYADDRFRGRGRGGGCESKQDGQENSFHGFSDSANEPSLVKPRQAVKFTVVVVSRDMDETDLVVARPRRRNRLPYQAARIGATIPLIALLASVVLRMSSGKLDWEEVMQTGIYPLGLVETAACAMGVVFALIALAAIPAKGTKGLLFPGAGGLVMSAGLLALAVLQLKQQEIHARQSFAIAEAEEELRHAMLDRYVKKRELALALDDVGDFVGQIEAATDVGEGKRAILLQVSADLSRQAAARARQFETDVRSFFDARLLAVASITNQADVTTRRESAQKLLDSSIAYRDYVANLEQSVRKLLSGTSLDEETQERFVSVFLQGSSAERKLVLGIREQDVRVATAARDLLQLLETSWGKWVHDPDDKITEFDTKELAEKFNEFTEEMQKATRESLRLQRQFQ